MPADPLETALRSLRPVAPALDRAALAAAAAPVERRRDRRGWKLAAVAGWATAAGVGGAWLLTPPRVETVERVLVRTVEVPAADPVPVEAPAPAAPPAEDEPPAAVPPAPPGADATDRLLAWLDSPAAGPLTAAGLRDVPDDWTPLPAPPAPRERLDPHSRRPSSPPLSVRELTEKWRDGRL